MSAELIQPPFPVYTDLNGLPLTNGYIYIGTFGLNPVTNPVSVYFDKDLLLPAAQPIRTVNGYPSNNGAAAQLYVDGNYSLVVQNSNQELVYSSLSPLSQLNVNDLPWYDATNYGDGSLTSDTISSAITDLGTSSRYALLLKKGTWVISNTITIPDNIQLYFENGAVLQVDSAVTLTINGPTPIAPLDQIFSVASTGSVVLGYLIDHAWGEWFGMISYDVDNTYAVQNHDALEKAIASHETIKIGIGTYRIQGEITSFSGNDIYGESPRSTILKFVALGNNQALFNMTSETNVTIRDMTLTATVHGFSGDMGIKLTTCTGCTAWNVSYSVLSLGFVDATEDNYNYSPEIALSNYGFMAARPTVQYKDATSVYFKGLDEVAMTGFYFNKKYKKTFAKKFTTTGSASYADLNSDLEFESSPVSQQWYAVFACADDNDTNITYKIVPYLQVGTISGSTVTFNLCGERQRTISGKTYNWSNDALNGAECLIISETIESRLNTFSGRVTTITDSTSTTATLDDAGGVDKFDFILPAPTSKKNYVWLADFYRDVAEIRNLADGNPSFNSDSVTIETGHSFDAEAICTPQSFSSGGVQNFSIDGANTSGGAWVGESGHLFTITSDANDSARTATITGIEEGVGATTEAIAVGDTTAVVSTKRFLSVSGITIDDDTVGNISIGIRGQDPVTGVIPTSAPGVPIVLPGLISPLATGISMSIGRAYSSTTIGEDAVKICHDSSNHIIGDTQISKEASPAYNVIPQKSLFCFSFSQMLYTYTGGALNTASNTRKYYVYGWDL